MSYCGFKLFNKRTLNNHFSRNVDKILTLYLDVNLTREGLKIVNLKYDKKNGHIYTFYHCSQFQFEGKKYYIIYNNTKEAGKVFWVFKMNTFSELGNYTLTAKKIEFRHECECSDKCKTPTYNFEQILKKVDKYLINKKIDSIQFPESPKDYFSISDIGDLRFRFYEFPLPHEIQIKTDFGVLYYSKLDSLKIGKKTKISFRIVNLHLDESEKIDIIIKLKTDPEYIVKTSLNVEPVQRFSNKSPPFWEWELTPISSGVTQVHLLIGKRTDEKVFNTLGSKEINVVIKSNFGYTFIKELKEGWKGFLIGFIPVGSKK